MRIVFGILVLMGSFLAFGQLQTSGGMSPTQLVQNVLLGEGVEVSNIQYSGSSQAIGTFNATNAILGIDEGIIITTGTIHPGPDGPFGPNNRPDSGLDNGVGGYQQLSNLVGAPTYNAAVLEFDFIPYSDTVSFKYVFASEEYPEYVGTEFNDVFAFFISGPGIPGGVKNMAIIPGTNQPVTINNVNHISNTAYYQNNGDGTQFPFNSQSKYLQYDGFTKPLIAYSPVQCGEKYHLVIAIADVSDAVWDSGIFLEKNSLSSQQPVKVDYQLTSNPYGDGQTMAQNCSSAIVTVTRSGSMINQALTIPVNISGSAIPGVDFSNFPTTITFAPGQTELMFTIDALNNPGLVGTVDLIIEFEIEDACGNDEFQTIHLFIKAVDPVAITVENAQVLCPDEPVELEAIATGGGGGYTFLWSTGESTPTISVSPSVTTSYTVSVTDACLNQTATTTATVQVPDFTPLELSMSPDIFEECPFMPNTIRAFPSGGAGQYTYRWFKADGKTIGLDDSLSVKPYETTMYYVEIIDFCGESILDSVRVVITSPPLVLSISPNQEICPGDSTQISVVASGGKGNYYYYWPHSGETTPTIWVKPSESTVYSVVVKDDCQTFQVTSSSAVDVVQPIADFIILDEDQFIGLPVSFQNTSQGASYYYWDLGDGRNSSRIHASNVYSDTGRYEIILIATDINGCVDTIVKPIRILEEFYMYIPNTFTPDGNQFNHTFSISVIGVEEFHILIYNRWGELLFEAKDPAFEWDGTYGGRLVEDGTYIWKMKYTTVNNPSEEVIQVGHVNMLR